MEATLKDAAVPKHKIYLTPFTLMKPSWTNNLMNKKIAIIIFILVVTQFAINIFCWQIDTKRSSISIREKGWAETLTFEVVDALVRFRRDKNRMPSRIAEMRPDYISNPDILFPSHFKKKIGLANVTMNDMPESLDISGAIKVFVSPGEESYYVVLSPLFFGSDHIAIRHWKSDKQTFDILPLREVKNLTSGYRIF